MLEIGNWFWWTKGTDMVIFMIAGLSGVHSELDMEDAEDLFLSFTCFQGETPKQNIQNAVPFSPKNRICGPSPHRSTGSFPGGFPKFGSNLPVNLSSSTRVNWGWLLRLVVRFWLSSVLSSRPIYLVVNHHLQQGWIGGDFWVFWYDFGPANKPPLKPWEILQCLVEVGENMWAKHVMTIPPVPSRKNCNNICDECKGNWLPKWPEHADWWNDCSHPAFRFWCKSEVELSEGRFDGESSCCAILVLCELHAWA